MNNGKIINLNWQFTDNFIPSYLTEEEYTSFSRIHIPHTVKEIPFNCFSHDSFNMDSTYVKYITIDQADAGREVLLQFDGVMARYSLYINGHFCAEHKGGYSPALYNITEYITFGTKNRILLHVNSSNDNNFAPFGKTFDYLTYGGIYRDVTLYVVSKQYIQNVLLRYELDVDKKEVVLKPEIYIDNKENRCDAQITVSLCRNGMPVKTYQRDIDLQKGMASYSPASETVQDIELWNLDNPTLYDAHFTLTVRGDARDTHMVKTGFRTCKCEVDGFYLNGKRMKLVGVDRHQVYPYVGYAMGKRAQELDAAIIRKEMYCNTVRTSHYIQSPHFLNKCDELGLLVFEEIPGWHTIGDEAYKEVSYNDLRAMILSGYNHPSIFMWGVRINESDEDVDFYRETNRIAKELDPDRDRGGVRFLPVSGDMFETVFTMNDFVNSRDSDPIVLRNQHVTTGLTYKVPYLVTEFCGHIHPTKVYDNEAVRESQGRVHARIINQVYNSPDILGAIAWMFTDYPTHGDYGSGDKICYHGVRDMFRVPKFSSFFYTSQCDPHKDQVVMELGSGMSRMDHLNRVNKQDVEVKSAPITVFTNCDYIALYKGDVLQGRYFPSTKYSGLPHPPVEMDYADNEWLSAWPGVTVVGYLDDAPVIQKTFSRDAFLSDLTIAADTTELYADQVDTSRVVCTFHDQNGNLLPYYNGILKIETAGDIEVIGPSYISTIGGSGSFWIKTSGKCAPGEASVVVIPVNSALQPQHISFKLICT